MNTHMIHSLKDYLQRPAQALAMGLVVFGVAFLLACSNEQDTQPTREPQPTATPTVAVPSPQPTPTQEAPSITAVPTSTDAATATPSSPSLQVVATSNIVADWAEVIGGDRVEVFSLVPPGSDPHSFVPGARDVAKVADADIVLSIGLGLEVDWLEELLHNASADESKVVALGDSIDALEFMEMGGHDDHGDDHAELDEQFLEGLRHVVHEVEDGEISAEEGLKEIEELLENFKHHAEGEEPQGPTDLVHELLLQFVRGEIDAEKAIEEMEHIAESEEDDDQGDEGRDDHGHEGHDHGPLDPHFWFDPETG